ncbi:hypothetical protein [Burkholderia ubonensis]|uniref:hypothetical protein n=1 Tax=Burkholderia ubonensis TaxID=101571 RepID=UPI000AEFA1DB|nr:hypothetical protein [Burkholderia ubonensis]
MAKQQERPLEGGEAVESAAPERPARAFRPGNDLQAMRVKGNRMISINPMARVFLPISFP